MKKSILMFLFVIGLTIISCYKEKCSYVEPYFQIKGLKSYNLRFTNEGTNPYIGITKNDTISWENYFNRISFESNYIATNSSNKLSLFGNSLSALDCNGEGYKGTKVGVKDMHIITLYNYNAQYQENDTIDSIIELNYWTSFISDYSKFFPIDEYIDQNKTSILNQYFEFKLVLPPDSISQTAQFRIIYELENGDSFQTVTEEVFLKK